MHTRTSAFGFVGLQRVLFALATLSVALCMATLALPNSDRSWLSFLLLAFPVLWTLWYGSVLFSPVVRGGWVRLMILWGLIDLAILVALVSLYLGNAQFPHMQGADAVVFTAYVPVVIPLGLLIGLLPEYLAHPMLHGFDGLEPILGGTGDGIALWSGLSLVAAVQSFVIAFAVRCWRNRRAGAS
jgi:hypothetical protein